MFKHGTFISISSTDLHDQTEGGEMGNILICKEETHSSVHSFISLALTQHLLYARRSVLGVKK